MLIFKQELEKKERKKLMDSMATVRHVARLSVQCWSKADEIFKLYEESKIKGQKKVKGSLGLPDCKKSNWQFLHGLSKNNSMSYCVR